MVMAENEEVNLDQLKVNAVNDTNSDPISESFVEKYKYLVEIIASKISKSQKLPPCIDYSDLVSFGLEGLLKAKQKYDENSNTKFETYAWYRVRGEILDCIRREWKYRIPKDYAATKEKLRAQLSDVIAENLKELDVSQDEDTLEDTIIENVTVASFLSNDFTNVFSERKGMKNPEVELIDESDDYIWDLIADLQDDERQIIELFYKEGKKQFEIAEILQYSTAKVCRLHMAILQKIKNRIQLQEKDDGFMS
mgnify:CR=1 FL=1